MKKPTPKQKNLIYDVGMHHGQDTNYYLLRGYKVIGFEANPQNIDFCKQRFAAEIKDGRLTIVEGAIADSSALANSDKVLFYRNTDHSLWGSTNKEWAYRSEVLNTSNELIEVNRVNFVECLDKFGIPVYMKADIVGDEILCLKALLDFENKPDYISIRSEKVTFKKLEEEFSLFEKLGYNGFKAIQQDITDWKIEFKNTEGGTQVYTFDEGASGPFGEDTPGRWKLKEDIIKEYKRIFTLYWLFGDYSFLVQTKKGKQLIYQMERLARRPLPGWYDTHARHSSISGA